MPFLPHLTAPRVSAAAEDSNAVVLLPVGAVEQHGPHLPVYTDTLIGQALAGRLDDGGLPLWTLPAIAYGKSNEHVAFPGTLSLTAETLLRALDEISASLRRSGFHRLALLNSHGGNLALLTVAMRDIRVRHGLMVCLLNPVAAVDVGSGPYGVEPEEARYGMHAGKVETSIMLALHPELVDLEAASGSPPDVFEEGGSLGFSGPNSVAWLSSDLSPDGTLGNPSGAGAEAGEWYVEEAVKAARATLKEFSRLEFPAEGADVDVR